MIDALKPLWQSWIHGAWNNKWACVRNGQLPCRVSFEVRWVSGHPHHTVSVAPGWGHSSMTVWHEEDEPGETAHEFGHMLGNQDEYDDSECPDRSPVNTGTIMDNNSINIPARLVQRSPTISEPTLLRLKLKPRGHTARCIRLAVQARCGMPDRDTGIGARWKLSAAG